MSEFDFEDVELELVILNSSHVCSHTHTQVEL